MREEIVGKRVGLYDVLYECSQRAKDGHKIYHVKCSECGYETDMLRQNIGKGKICKHKNSGGMFLQYNYKFSNDRLRIILNGMRSRCYNPNDKRFVNYGQKGINVCDEWLTNPLSFEQWALENGYSDDLTINRIDCNKNYCPKNCEWVTLEYNSKYKSTTRLIDVDGESHSGKDWAKILGIGSSRINTYVRKYGLENTVEFIRRFRKSPILIGDGSRSYYELYMDKDNTIQNDQ